ncbi:MAG: hypothetical protein QG556_357 [Pseudomonadota bacterium]|nr:hypothetical protein [Pseudomonadota bacterium]
MHYFKKGCLYLLGFMTCSSFAGTMGEACVGTSILTPCEQKAWLISGQALYLISNTQIYGSPYILSSGRESMSYGLAPDWGWGFRFEGAYLFGMGHDLNLNWYHYRHSNNERNKLGGQLSYTYQSTDYDILNDYQYDSISPQWDQVNIEIGQLMFFSSHKTMRVHAGGQFSRVANQTYTYSIEDTYINGIDTQNTGENMSASSTFNGFGPRLGMDLGYLWDNGIGLYAKGSGFLLGGATKSNFIVGNYQARKDSNLTRAIAGIEARLGVNYHYVFRYGQLDADIGWLWDNYINALGAMDSFTSKSTHYSNFEIQGLYMGLKWVC